MENEEYYTAQEIADKLKVNIMTVYRHINSGKLSAIKTGKDFRVLKSDFESYLQNSQQRSVVEEKDNKILLLEKEISKLQRNIKKQRYGLVWVDVAEAFEDDVENKLPILKENPKLAIENINDKPTHILIEGDNYHSLTCLNYTHKEKIDAIYIDPPYNTGSDGFRYKDKRILDKYPDGTDVPKDSPYRHSYWLSFMRKRLELSRDILKETGVIFISIDINELAQLKLLADEVYGENNLVSLISVKVKDPAGVGQQSHIFDVCEYILMYAKNISEFKNYYQELPMDFEEVKEHLNSYGKIVIDFGKPELLKEIERQNVGKIKVFKCEEYKIEKTKDMPLGEYVKNRKMIFADYNPNGGMILAIKDQIPKAGLSYLEYTPTKGRDAGKTVKTYFYNGRILSWLDNIVIYENKKLYRRSKMTNFWNIPNASLYLEGGVDFTNGKKPLRLIKKVISTLDRKDLIVLDYFAGSGTTGEAVMDLNEEDGGNRQFILCTNNEDGIMTNTCYKRINNAIKGYRNKQGSANSVKYYNAAFVGKNNVLNSTDNDRIELAHNAGELLAIAENTLYEQGRNDYYQIFRDGDRYTAVYFREEMDKYDEFIKEVQSLKAREITAYVFSWEADETIYELEEMKNIRLKTIPQPIVEIYKQIYNLV
ncbi:hypothetical protein COX25_03345 [bacterium (Candidatus Howlettbacteria) CG23_combo_of_CG06-09_8_20_14_all_37_9]|nr:MAG: hypothetical protein COX25_03345 [bacterium (Candidatus Howlettbacteria) CG23_combo_of_CG06-09_8_20_14_all_37_9]